MAGEYTLDATAYGVLDEVVARQAQVRASEADRRTIS